ncbi:MAG TPA: hypothetical protein VEL74_17880 [Thermoanaerobaculia bacterium]|nr:hypothetical protein [Thermoanaerobaculia bacterium]
MQKVLNALAGTAFVLAALPAVSSATTVVEVTPEDMMRQAQVIVAGHCVHKESAWVGRDLVTLATFSVSEGFKGAEAGTQITVVLPGGVDLKRRVPIAKTYPAAPQLGDQEQALLFLTPETRVPDGYMVVGYSQGKFTLVTGPDGKKMAAQDLGGLSLVGKSGGLGHGNSRAIPYDQFRRQILDAVAGRRSEP